MERDLVRSGIQFNFSVKVVRHIYPANEVVNVYTSRKNVKIRTEHDICPAYPVMEDFEISVRELLSAGFPK